MPKFNRPFDDEDPDKLNRSKDYQQCIQNGDKITGNGKTKYMYSIKRYVTRPNTIYSRLRNPRHVARGPEQHDYDDDFGAKQQKRYTDDLMMKIAQIANYSTWS